MEKYGIENVRRCSFVKFVLSNEEIIMIRKMIYNTKDICFNCGSKNHFVRDCIYNKIYNKKKCKTIDNNNISIDELITILQTIDDVILDKFNKDDIYRLIQYINKNKNIKIDIENISYRNFIFGIILYLA